MGLRNTAYLQITATEDRQTETTATGTFEFRHTDDINTTLEKDYLVGQRGQYLQQVAENVGETLNFDISRETATRRSGIAVDAGVGRWTESFDFEVGQGDLTWGDGDGGTGPANVTHRDASGADVHPLTRQQVLAYWVAQTRSDSFGNARLHIGEWTDGSLDDYRDGTYENVSAGVYGHPIPIAIETVDMTKSGDEPSVFTGNFSGYRVNLLPWTEAELADWVFDHLGALVGPITPTYIPDE